MGGNTVVSVDQSLEALSLAYPGQLDRQERVKRALKLFQTYLGLMGLTFEKAIPPMTVIAFKGYLAIESDMHRADRIAIAWSLCDWLVIQGLLHEEDVQLAMSQDEAFDMSVYLEF